MKDVKVRVSQLCDHCEGRGCNTCLLTGRKEALLSLNELEVLINGKPVPREAEDKQGRRQMRGH